MTLTASSITQAIIRRQLARSFILPRYTPNGWWEADAFEVTKSGYFREYEVKLTVSDFKADRHKERKKWMSFTNVATSVENKHDLLASHDPRGPAQFWYVTPVGLLDDQTLPPWAGLIEVSEWQENQRSPIRLVLHDKVKAPRLHKVKLDKNVLDHAWKVSYYRYIHLLSRLDAAKAELDIPDDESILVDPAPLSQ